MEEAFLTSLYTGGIREYLLYADWLDEQLKSDEAEWLRLVCNGYTTQFVYQSYVLGEEEYGSVSFPSL